RSLSVVLANGQEVNATEVLFAPPMINGLPIRFEDSSILPSFKINKVIANRFCSLAGLNKASHFEPVGTPRGYTGDVSV
ncbi:hypothetical protein NQU49_28305, partial [Escherichia coli]|uniref:hypothetical protein n=1 Tax=Escherichia coli TaxID=562 RepID=UPI0021193B8A